VFDQATQRDPTHRRTWVVLVDGARHQLELIQAEAARRGVRIHILIDFIHVLEYLWRAAWCFHADADPDAEPWVATHALKLLAGEADAVITALHQQAAQQAAAAGLTATQRGGVERLYQLPDRTTRPATSIHPPVRPDQPVPEKEPHPHSIQTVGISDVARALQRGRPRRGDRGRADHRRVAGAMDDQQPYAHLELEPLPSALNAAVRALRCRLDPFQEQELPPELLKEIEPQRGPRQPR
jgi:hypothetical protein